VPYAQHGNTVLTLGPPVCAPEAMASAAADFLSHFPGATFFYVTDEQCRRMALPHHHACPAGADFILPLPAPSWPKEAAAAARKARRAHFHVREVPPAQLAAMEPAMRSVQQAYLAQREVSHEMTFLTRPCLFAEERLGRTFAMEVAGEMMGFVVIDPYVTVDGGHRPKEIGQRGLGEASRPCFARPRARDFFLGSRVVAAAHVRRTARRPRARCLGGV
ncbi:MAG: phosphatidylglycerol lysyltransferase domain-containing protein, partial [Myxococcaceae bacterium]